MTPAQIAAALARVEVAHDALALSSEIPRQILAQDGAPSLNLIRWSKKNGISLDWILTGDVAQMVISTSRWRKRAQ